MEEKSWVFNEVSQNGTPTDHHLWFTQFNINPYEIHKVFIFVNNVVIRCLLINKIP
jgi:hypothetical protein